MIRSLTGRIVAQEDDGPIVAVGGVGVLGRVSVPPAGHLPSDGREVTLLTHLAVREDALDLYGFVTGAERRLFEALLSVSGVGARLALAVCGVGTPDEVRLAVARGDSARLQAAPGVGKRIAERIVLELRDRLGAVEGSDGAHVGAPQAADRYLEAREALVGLGFRLEEADAALADLDDDLPTEQLVRRALKGLRRG